MTNGKPKPPWSCLKISKWTVYLLLWFMLCWFLVFLFCPRVFLAFVHGVPFRSWSLSLSFQATSFIPTSTRNTWTGISIFQRFNVGPVEGSQPVEPPAHTQQIHRQLMWHFLSFLSSVRLNLPFDYTSTWSGHELDCVLISSFFDHRLSYERRAGSSLGFVSGIDYVLRCDQGNPALSAYIELLNVVVFWIGLFWE